MFKKCLWYPLPGRKVYGIPCLIGNGYGISSLVGNVYGIPCTCRKVMVSLALVGKL